MGLGWFGVGDRVAYSNHWWQALAAVCVTQMGLWGPMLLGLTGAHYVLRRRNHPTETQ
jgi:hypothetical protein